MIKKKDLPWTPFITALCTVPSCLTRTTRLTLASQGIVNIQLCNFFQNMHHLLRLFKVMNVIYLFYSLHRSSYFLVWSSSLLGSQELVSSGNENGQLFLSHSGYSQGLILRTEMCDELILTVFYCLFFTLISLRLHVSSSWQATGPFLQFGAVGALTLLSPFVLKGFHAAKDKCMCQM